MTFIRLRSIAARWGGGHWTMRVLPQVTCVTLLSFAEIYRDRDPPFATRLSILGWILTLLLARRDVQILGLGLEGRWRLFSAVHLFGAIVASTGILLVFYHRTLLIHLGFHPDLVFSHLGFRGFLALNNPISAGGSTPAYPLFALMILANWTTVPLPFAVFGPYAMVFGYFLMVATLITFVTFFVMRTTFPARMLAVLLVSALSATRLNIQEMAYVAYCASGMCLAFVFWITLLREQSPRTATAIGLLMSCMVLHHYQGIVNALPIATVLVLRKGGRKFFTEVLKTPTLQVAISIVFTTTLINPALLLTRVRDVTVGVGTTPPLAEIFQRILGKISLDRLFDMPHFVFKWMTVAHPGSWLLVSVPPFGGDQAIILLVELLLAIAVCSHLRVPFLRQYGLLAVLCVTVSALQHLTTDMMDYRDFTFLTALSIAPLIFLAETHALLETSRRALVYGIALMLCVLQYLDLGSLRGRYQLSSKEYGHFEFPLAISLERWVRESRAFEDGGTVYLVRRDILPMQLFLKERFESSFGVDFDSILAKEFCENPEASLRRLLAKTPSSHIAVGVSDKICPNLDTWESKLEPLNFTALRREGGVRILVPRTNDLRPRNGHAAAETR